MFFLIYMNDDHRQNIAFIIPTDLWPGPVITNPSVQMNLFQTPRAWFLFAKKKKSWVYEELRSWLHWNVDEYVYNMLVE